MMAEGRFFSLPRNMHVGQQCTLASSMDLLSSQPAMAEMPVSGYQGVSIHGTLPRKKKNGTSSPVKQWEMNGNTGSSVAPYPGRYRLPPSPLIHNILEEHQAFHSDRTSSVTSNFIRVGDLDSIVIKCQPPERLAAECFSILSVSACRDGAGMDSTMEYVKFSRDKYIMDGPPEKLRRELEEELKLSSEEPQSHAWYHGAIPRQVAENLVQRDGDFLIRDSLSSPGNYVLTCQWKNTPRHFKINKRVVAMNEAYSRVQYLFEKEGFDSVPALVRYYVGNREPVSEVVGAIIFQPINRALPLRCLEEKYGVGTIRVEAGYSEKKSLTSKRLSLNIMNGHTQDHTLSRGNLLSNKDKCGSQPACLNHVQERRRPLKTHQSESFLPIGCRPQAQVQHMQHQPCPKSPVFRTGSEPVLSPTMPRRMAFDTQSGAAIHGSDSQLCPKPPPKPSKVPSMRVSCTPGLKTLSPPVPPVKPHKHQPSSQQQQQSGSPELSYCELSPCRPADWEKMNSSQANGYVEKLKTEEELRRSNSSVKLDRSSYHNSIEALNNNSEEDNEEDVDKERDCRKGFQRPVFETETAFKPGDINFRLLPVENKPLEMTVLKKAKELLVSQDPKTIAKHILKADCQVARILNVSEEVKDQMGVTSGLELVTLPHGRQLRQDLMERHNTMAIGVAVDILGCTGSLEERAATLNRIILVALELKDSMGDLYAFSSIMKALDMPQITRLDHTWTSLRRKYTQSAIIYEKSLKPFYKGLYNGSAEIPLSNASVPLLMPLLTLMERPAVTFEGMDAWENNDQGCEIMFRHLEGARAVARNADTYTCNAQRILQGFQPNDDMLEILRTDFQLRLLWGSRGAAVDQTERHDKFKLILTALSRKLEPPVKHTEL
ncbi:breast cancer anti-estrogen resistance protein 3 homolog isoform X2 [Cyprinus carpio]|nr:breast cancer anti-estrogen resistance protein 3 homolog isoform X2 [Cyprinus carpio]